MKEMIKSLTPKRIFSALYIIFTMVVFIVVLINCFKDKLYSNFDNLFFMDYFVEQYFPEKGCIRELYGASNLVLSPNEIAFENGAIIKDDNGFLTQIKCANYDVKEIEKHICELNNVCKDSGADFVYVSLPSKSDSSINKEKYGVDTNNEEMRDELFKWTTENNIHFLNMRTKFEQSGYNSNDIFYKTDHHWKTTLGLYATKEIADYLNSELGYNLNSDILGAENYNYTEYKDLWLGETGRKFSKTWTGSLDDFTKITPKFDTYLTTGNYYEPESRYGGDFYILLDESGLNNENDLYKYSAYYSYNGYTVLNHIHNENVDGKKILLVKDSFSVAIIPFLSLATSDLVMWDLRDTSDSLFEFIKSNDFDCVIVAYTDYWSEDVWNFH